METIDPDRSELLPRRNWWCESSTVARLHAAIVWLQTGHQDPSRNRRNRRDSRRDAILETLRCAARRTAILDAAGSSCAATDPGAGYTTGMNRGDYCRFDAELAAVSGQGGAATADPKVILGPEDQYLLAEEHLLLPEGERLGKAELEKIPVHLGVLQGHYPKLHSRMYRSGMICFLPPNTGAIENSIFGVWKEKGATQRVIWGGTRSNLLLRPEASRVELPTPHVLADLRVPKNERLFLASCDISQFYNRLAAPPFLIPFLGLPRVRSALVDADKSTKFVVPCLRCISMGATFAVSIAQTISQAAIRAAGLGNHLLMRSKEVWLEGGPGAQIAYIDDLSSVGTSRDKSQEWRWDFGGGMLAC